jgi:PAS domain S-box-containing protein
MDQSDFDPGSLAVEATDEVYRLIADTIPQIVWSARSDGSGEFHNARASEYYGIDASRLAGMGWQAMVHPDDLRAASILEQRRSRGSPFSVRIPPAQERRRVALAPQQGRAAARPVRQDRPLVRHRDGYR